MKNCFFSFISKRMTQELGRFKCFSILAILCYFSLVLVYFFVKWNLRCATLLWWRNKPVYFIIFWSVELSFFVTLTNLHACEENKMQQGLCYERGFHFHQHVTQLCSCITISCMENNLKVISFTQPGAFPPDFNYLYALSFW